MTAPEEPADGLDQLTPEEARAEVERLSTELYTAQDALAYVGECLAIHEREQPGQPVTTAQVRRWLEGPKCGRQLAAQPAPSPLQRSAAGTAGAVLAVCAVAWRLLRHGPHWYLSTSCLHAREPGREDLHGYCQSNTGLGGAKRPASCKFCRAPCRCRCHRQ